MKKFLSQYRRRQSDPVRIGGRGNGKAVGAVIGGGYPVAVQTMTDTSTMDTGACVAQIERIREAGCRIVRLTAPGRREAENLGEIREELRRRGIDDMALVADIHFNPEAAMIAADHVDKVRINPGNFGPADGSQLEQLLEKCRAGSVALRIGVNHGSLARHIVEKWGDTPRGMVESAMEFLRECRRQDFNQVVVSMKSSNVRVMVHAYRLLAARMDAEGMRYPLHLGVTEAGDGADGRIKSAAGIGALLADGIGDTIRVSLTEPPENEIPVARQLVDYFANREPMAPLPLAEGAVETYDPYTYSRRKSDSVGNLGGENMPLLPSELDAAAREALVDGRIAVITATSPHPAIEWRAKVLGMIAQDDRRPVILHRTYRETSLAALQLRAAADFGMPLIDGLADGIHIENIVPQDAATDITQEAIDETALTIMQATRARISRTEYIACPGCGRTLFGLQETLAAVKRRTSHLKGLKIGVMGCIVNGPGEMADADYGYVGEGPGRVTLYKSREVVQRGIPQEHAIDALVELIRQNGDWREPESR